MNAPSASPAPSDAPAADAVAPMRIAIVIEHIDPQGGGAERSTLQIIQELVRRGHTVTLIAGAACGELSQTLPPGVQVQALSNRRSSGVGRLLRFARFARQAIDAGGFDVSLSVTTAAAADVVQPRGGTMRETLARNIAMRPTFGRRLAKRLGLWCSPKHQALLAIERRTLRDPRVQRFAAVSRYVAEQLQRHYAVAADRITLIPNAAVAPVISEAQRQQARREIRAGFGLEDDAYVLAFAALNPRLKGIEPLLHTLALLRERKRSVTLLAAGQFNYAQQKLAADLGVREQVRVVGRTDRMAELYCAADVTVLPTFYDPSSKVVLESLMLGVPAISTHHNGASDFIDPSRMAGGSTPSADTGGGVSARRGRVVADPWDIQALAEAIEALADADERRRCADAAAGLAQELSMARHVDRLEALLAQVATARA